MAPHRQGPQEWKWLLKDRGILLSSDADLAENTRQKTREVLAASSTPPRRTIQVLPDDAMIHSSHYWDLTSNDSDKSSSWDELRKDQRHVQHALDWLHVVVSREMPVLDAAVERCQDRCKLLQSQEQLFKEHSTKLRQDFSSMCDALGMSDYFKSIEKVVVGENSSSSVKQILAEYIDTTCVPQSRFQLQKILETHGEFLREVMEYQKNVLTRLHQPSCAISLPLDELLHHDVTVSSVANDWNSLTESLQELLAFVKVRRREIKSASSQQQQQQPPFLTWISASEDASVLERYVRELESIQSELNKRPLSVVGLLFRSKEHVNRLGLQLERMLDQWKEARCQQERVEREAAEEHDKLQSLQQDKMWCRDRIDSLRAGLELEIDSLLGTKNNERCIIEIDI